MTTKPRTPVIHRVSSIKELDSLPTGARIGEFDTRTNSATDWEASKRGDGTWGSSFGTTWTAGEVMDSARVRVYSHYIAVISSPEETP